MWFYICLVMAGVIVGFVIFQKIDDPETTINENTNIGKIKMRGEGNSSSIPIDPKALEAAAEPDTRLGRREARLMRRLARIREREDKKESG